MMAIPLCNSGAGGAVRTALMRASAFRISSGLITIAPAAFSAKVRLVGWRREATGIDFGRGLSPDKVLGRYLSPVDVTLPLQNGLAARPQQQQLHSSPTLPEPEPALDDR